MPDGPRSSFSVPGRESLFTSLLAWVEEHVDALPEEVFDFDEEGVLYSLQAIVKGHLGCTEESDYTPEQWAVMQAVREARV